MWLGEGPPLRPRGTDATLPLIMCPPPPGTVTAHVIQTPPPPLQSRVSAAISSLLYILHEYNFADLPSLSFRLPSLPFLLLHSSLHNHVHHSYPFLGSQPSPQCPSQNVINPHLLFPSLSRPFHLSPLFLPLVPPSLLHTSHLQFTLLPLTGGQAWRLP